MVSFLWGMAKKNPQKTKKLLPTAALFTSEEINLYELRWKDL